MEVDNEMGKLPSHFPEVYPNSSWFLYDLNEDGQICQKTDGSKDNQWNVPQDIEDWHPDPPNHYGQETASSTAAWEAVGLAFLSNTQIEIAVNKVWNDHIHALDDIGPDGGKKASQKPYKGKWKWLKDKDYQLRKIKELPSYLKDANDELEQLQKDREIRSPAKRTRLEDEPFPTGSPTSKRSKKDTAGMESLATSGGGYMNVNEFTRNCNNRNFQK
ncbi:unnamed protein product [Cylindrotheca closterium]|uniref:Uncharacterized protein n=1 Tax=Cylindrotheca closterium TaxID=2856 RepID=A0AAD2CLZ6_9STRA|nr:unnamed protein product [Cylindrotheca closterium]